MRVVATQTKYLGLLVAEMFIKYSETCCIMLSKLLNEDKNIPLMAMDRTVYPLFDENTLNIMNN